MRFGLYASKKILVFKTDINAPEIVEPILNNQEGVLSWSIDSEDVDRVLRLETNTSLSENKVIDTLSKVGVTSMVMTW
ncbi:MAG: hypothetical protein ACI857_000593 [Arenicella sp.]|jgi:hypothetical protein